MLVRGTTDATTALWAGTSDACAQLDTRGARQHEEESGAERIGGRGRQAGQPPGAGGCWGVTRLDNIARREILWRDGPRTRGGYYYRSHSLRFSPNRRTALESFSVQCVVSTVSCVIPQCRTLGKGRKVDPIGKVAAEGTVYRARPCLLSRPSYAFKTLVHFQEKSAARCFTQPGRLGVFPVRSDRRGSWRMKWISLRTWR